MDQMTEGACCWLADRRSCCLSAGERYDLGHITCAVLLQCAACAAVNFTLILAASLCALHMKSFC